jgi:hypothetical protein
MSQPRAVGAAGVGSIRSPSSSSTSTATIGGAMSLRDRLARVDKRLNVNMQGYYPAKDEGLFDYAGYIQLFAEWWAEHPAERLVREQERERSSE